MSTCSHCGGDLPENATFCPSCGRRVDAGGEGPVDVRHAEPRYFGLGPPLFVLAVMVGLIVLGLVLVFVVDFFALGMLALVLGIVLLPTFLAGARRWPESRVSQVGISTADRVRDEADVAVESITTWSRAGRDAFRLRREQHTLRRRREAKIRELGESVYADDGRADELKAEARELDEQLERNERELQKTIAGARRRVRKGRAAVVATEVIKPEPGQEKAAPATEVVAADEGATVEDATVVAPSEELEEGAAPRADGERRDAEPSDGETKVVKHDDVP